MPKTWSTGTDMVMFSVITVTKANPDGLARTRDSVQLQSIHDYEWIVVDGEVEADAGIYDAMNKGLARARGDYVLFMNAGDVFAAMNTLQVLAQQAGADFIYGDAIEAGCVKPARHDIVDGMMTHHQAMVYRRALIGDIRFDTRYRIAADYKFTAQFLARAQSQCYVPLPLCVFEVGGVSQRKAALGRQEEAAIRRALGLCSRNQAMFIVLRQVVARQLKTMLPKLYWFMRQRKWGIRLGMPR